MSSKLIILTFVLLMAVQIFGYPAYVYPYLNQPNGINYVFPNPPSTNFLGGYGSTWDRAVAEQLLYP